MGMTPLSVTEQYSFERPKAAGWPFSLAARAAQLTLTGHQVLIVVSG